MDSISILFPFLILFLMFFLKTLKINVVFGRHSYLCIFLFYNILGVAWLGSFLVYLGVVGESRLNVISNGVKQDVYLLVSFSVVVQLIFFIIYALIYSGRSLNGHELLASLKTSYSKKYYSLALFLAIFSCLYSLLKVILFYKYSPVLLALNGNILDAAAMRADIQRGVLSLDIKYISKVMFYISYYLPVYSLILFFVTKSNKLKGIFYLSCLSSIVYLGFDGQKSGVLLLFLMLLITYIYFKGIGIKVLFYIGTFLAMVLAVFYVMAADDVLVYDILQRILDRLLSGQNQAMYFIYQFYGTSYTGIFSDLFFSGLLGLNEVKPDQQIASYIYKDTSHIVNVNTYYLGESLAFFGVYGALVFALVIPFIIVLYCRLFDKLISRSFFIYWPMALVFFTLLPVNQSLQFILYQKYLVYFLVFFLLPIFLSNKLINFFRRT